MYRFQRNKRSRPEWTLSDRGGCTERGRLPPGSPFLGRGRGHPSQRRGLRFPCAGGRREPRAETTVKPTPIWTAGLRKRWPNGPGRSPFDPPRTSGIGCPDFADGYALYDGIQHLAKHAFPHVRCPRSLRRRTGEQFLAKADGSPPSILVIAIAFLTADARDARSS